MSDAFLFAAVMSDSENCRLMLEMILGIPISSLEVHSEHNILFRSDYKSVRLDVFASTKVQVDYDVEMQNEKENLAKRSRFYQVRMDSVSLKPGEDYNALHPNYVIFICTYDPFGYGLYRYVFENRCQERNFPLNDGTTKIFLNTKGTNSEDVPKALVDFLHYVEDSSDKCAVGTQNGTLAKLHRRIVSLKKSREWEERYMTLADYIQAAEKKAERIGLEQGLEQGRALGLEQGLAQGQKLGLEQGQKLGLAQGQNKLLNLIQCMCANGEADQIPRLSSDPAFLEEAFRKYGFPASSED